MSRSSPQLPRKRRYTTTNPARSRRRRRAAIHERSSGALIPTPPRHLGYLYGRHRVTQRHSVARTLPSQPHRARDTWPPPRRLRRAQGWLPRSAATLLLPPLLPFGTTAGTGGVVFGWGWFGRPGEPPAVRAGMIAPWAD